MALTSDLTAEQLVLAPSERRPTVLKVIRSARKRLILSLFRCDDFDLLDELAKALRRNVRVRVLLTGRARGGKKRLRKLWTFLEGMGAEVHRYGDPVVKYHAKYIVADDGPALIASLNFNQKCFKTTCDFLLLSYDRDVVSGLQTLFEADCRPNSSLLESMTDRLVIGPDRARRQFVNLIQGAHRSIRIIDPKLSDPDMIALLKTRRRAGVRVEVLGGRVVGNLVSHGKLMIVDDSIAVLGSISLAALSLDFRREVAILVTDPVCLRQLNECFHHLSASAVSDAGPINQNAAWNLFPPLSSSPSGNASRPFESRR